MNVTHYLPGQLIIRDVRFNHHLVNAAKAIPGMRWDPAERGWVGYTDAVSLVLQALNAKGIRVAASEDVQKLIVEAGHVHKPIGFEATSQSGKKIRGYQTDGVHFLLDRAPQGALLADDMRLGKTMQTILALRALGWRTVIVCPNYVRNVWRNELTEWWPRDEFKGGLIIEMPAGLKAKPLAPTVDVVIIHWDILHAWVDALLAWGFTSLVFDEAHALVNEKSQRSRAAKRLRAHASRCIALTGTPLPNHMSDMWNVVNTICPGRFGEKFFNYGMRYCDGHQEDITFNAGGAKTTKTVFNFKGKSNEDELHERLKYFMLRRTKSDVMTQLPKKIRQSIWVDVKAEKKRAYIPASESKAAMRAALDKSADAKMPQASALILAHLAEGKKVVAFSWRRHIAEGLGGDASEAGHTVGVIHGGVHALQRELILRQCAAHDGALLVAATIDSAGVGIDLSWADVIVFVELGWEHWKLLQAEARGFSLTNTRGLFIQYVLARGTADELVANVVLAKLDTAERVVGSADAGNVRDDLQESEEDVMAQLYRSMGVK